MTTLQHQARALGDPTRHAIFRALADAGRPVGIAELTEQLPVTHNAVRQHLARLVEAGLVLEARATPAGRGRPRLLYELDPVSAGSWGAPGPYERLSRLLIEIITTGSAPEDVGRNAAHQFRVPAPTGDAAEDVRAAMARQGFDPELRPARRGAEVVLHTCPFASAALADRHTVCALHLGIAEGLTAGTDLAVRELVANDPRRADCRIRLRDVAPGVDGPEPTLVLRGGSAR
jgi:predicted ArsR family transcriptional regulator